MQRYIGIDVQSSRDCPYAVLDDGSSFTTAGGHESEDALKNETKPTAVFSVISP